MSQDSKNIKSFLPEKEPSLPPFWGKGSNRSKSKVQAVIDVGQVTWHFPLTRSFGGGFSPESFFSLSWRSSCAKIFLSSRRSARCRRASSVLTRTSTSFASQPCRKNSTVGHCSLSFRTGSCSEMPSQLNCIIQLLPLISNTTFQPLALQPSTPAAPHELTKLSLPTAYWDAQKVGTHLYSCSNSFHAPILSLLPFIRSLLLFLQSIF